MSTNTLETGIPPEVMADMKAIVEAITTGKPVDPVIAARVRERAEKSSAEVFRRHGLLDIGVPAIREFRDR
jgi:hypothetical protein